MLPARLLFLWDFPGKNIGVVCHFFLQGIFPTQGMNPCALYCGWILYHWATRDAHTCSNSLSHFKLGGLSFAVENTLINICSLNCECLTSGCRGNPRIRDRKGYVFKIQLYVFTVNPRDKQAHVWNGLLHLLIHSFIHPNLLPPSHMPAPGNTMGGGEAASEAWLWGVMF